MAKGTYSKRQWLNKKGSPSTGAVAAYHGQSPWERKGEYYSYFEVSDCHNSIRLHKTEIDSQRDFIRKIRKLSLAAKEFADFLEKNK